jgi:hypothetical protein
VLRFVCLMALCGAAPAFQNDTTPSGRERENDIYRIYSFLMTSPRTSHGADDNPRYLVAESTRSETAQQPCVRPPKDREAEFREVLTDFEARKATPRTLKRQLSIRKPYEFLTVEQVKTFQNERDWPRPNPRRPNAQFEGVTDLFILADVYFSKNGRLAMTAVSSWCGGLCGQHEWKVLEKLPTGVWQVQPWITCFTIAGGPEHLKSPPQIFSARIGARTFGVPRRWTGYRKVGPRGPRTSATLRVPLPGLSPMVRTDLRTT